MFKTKGVILFLLVAFFAVSLVGCATTGKKSTEQELKDQVSTLERQLQDKDAEISNLRDALAASIQEKENFAKSKVCAKYTMKDIQTALKNAGFDPGTIDGKGGKQTKEAIKAFQKANGLVADGKVGKKTWALLGAYIEKKIK
ncbi:MAG: peptidoglycan-binding protein [Candidatus Omnitrophica bacterium]|nr:peptidoglycan-binding protein [Candidatus Omnitrophota bacterium]